MDTNIQEWHGFKVHGYVKALDEIVNYSGFINLDSNDIETTFIGEGSNWVVTATAPTIAEALASIKEQLPAGIERMAIAIISGASYPVSEIHSLGTLAPNPDVHLCFGFYKNPEMTDSVKLVVVIKAKP